MIEVFDNFLNDGEIKLLDKICIETEFSLSGQASFRVDGESRDRTLGRLLDERHPQYAFFKKIEDRLVEMTNNEYYVTRRFINAFKFGDASKAHTDVFFKGSDENKTALIYCNKEWDVNWGAETVFLDKVSADAEIVKSVIPRPGRLLLYQANLPHCARVPNSLFPYYRYSLVYNLQVKDIKKTLL